MRTIRRARELRLLLLLVLFSDPLTTSAAAKASETASDTGSGSRGGVAPELSALSFLEGAWSSQAFGGEIEEAWLPPRGDAMHGVFRLVVDGRLRFSEFVQITLEAERPVMRFAHFRPDYTTWEGQGPPMELELVEVGEDHAVFSALNPSTPDSIVYRRIGSDRLDVRVTGIDGVLRFRRLP